MSQRADGRITHDMRPMSIPRGWLDAGESSVLVSFDKTTVLCVVSFAEGVPCWRKDTGLGWVTTEYLIFLCATDERSAREPVKEKIGGRTHEISRLIDRTLRARIDMRTLGENTIQLDCDILRVGGGTRTVLVTGALAVLADTVDWAVGEGIVKPRRPVLSGAVSVVSVGIIDGHPAFDLPYEEDSHVDTDMNMVATGAGQLTEIQGTVECTPFSRGELGELLDLAVIRTAHLAIIQEEALTGENPIDPRVVVGWEGR